MRHTRQPLPPLPARRNAPSWELEGWGAPGEPWAGGDFLDELDQWEGWGMQVAPDGGPVAYDEFRAGVSFSDVAAALDVEARHKLEATGERMFITRRTILGRMYQIKRESYTAYLAEFDPAP